MIELKKKDEKILNTLLGIGSSVASLLYELGELEAKEEKDSPIWQEKIKALNSSLSLEDSLYSKLDIKTIERINDYLDGDALCDRLLNQFQSIFDLDTKEIVRKRVILKLDTIFEAYKAIHPYGLLDRLYAEDYQMTKVVKSDYFNTFFNILNLYINNPEYASVKEYLLKIKYSFSIMYEEVLDEFREVNFDVKPLYWVSDAVAEQNNFVLGYNRIFSKIINDSCSIINSNLNSDLSYERAIFVQILSRVVLLFNRDADLQENLIAKFNELINTAYSTNNRVIKQNWFLIPESIQYMEKDKELVNLVSFQR